MRSPREEKVNAFTVEETPLSRIRTKAKAKVERDAGHIVLSGGTLFISNCRRVSFFLSHVARRARVHRSHRRGEERRKVMEKEGSGSYEAEKRRDAGIVFVRRLVPWFLTVGFLNELSIAIVDRASCEHFFAFLSSSWRVERHAATRFSWPEIRVESSMLSFFFFSRNF